MVQTMILYLLYDMIHDPYSYCTVSSQDRNFMRTCNVTVSQDDETSLRLLKNAKVGVVDETTRIVAVLCKTIFICNES
jgi:hypothetical protein